MNVKPNPPDPQAMIGEFGTLDECFRTLVTSLKNTGVAKMATFVIDDNLGGLLVVADLPSVARLSRLIAVLGQSVSVKMPL
jgi:hypothetical protein